ncbi:hypothetical protein HNW77_05805 [Komagataeibacter sp. AV436]|uniref:Lipoprotein n=1 Tax=Komagataeibacter melomenusus TaxID=2766578 RepID=A0ABX2ACR5_9PROT|nr:hypothetical protein [Komagataeibacter melomenusus]MBV1830355.1 hypothetical protein [Komagataeibacter melomenusus]NPC65911.1 hypothetical protein [Komagataeibacter melomenusus]
MPRPSPRFARRALVVAALCLPAMGGCRLLSQKTFNRHAGDPPSLPAAPVPAVPTIAAPPLVTIVAGTPPAQWQPAVRAAVADALSRKPNALFTIVVNVPAGAASGVPDMKAAVDTYGQPVLQAVIDAGAGTAQTEMDARGVPPGSATQVCIYVE